MLLKVFVVWVLVIVPLSLAGNNAEGLVDCVSMHLAGLPEFSDIDLKKDFGLILDEGEWDKGEIKLYYQMKNKPKTPLVDFKSWEKYFGNNFNKASPKTSVFNKKCYARFKEELSDLCASQEEKDEITKYINDNPGLPELERYGRRYKNRLECIGKLGGSRKGALGEFGSKIRFEATNNHKSFNKLVDEIPEGRYYELVADKKVRIVDGSGKEINDSLSKRMKENLNRAYKVFLDHLDIISYYDSFSRSSSGIRPVEMGPGFSMFDKSWNARNPDIKKFNVVTGESC